MMQILLHSLITLFNQLKSLFINGLITILPITITLVVIGFAIRTINRFFLPLRCIIETTPLKDIPYIEFILIIGTLLALGLVYRLFIIKSFFNLIDKLLGSVPLIRTLHTGVRQLISSLTSQDAFSFRHVVLVEFPRTGVYSIGFVMSEFSSEISGDSTKHLYSVYIPTTPNPTTGFLIMCEESQFKIINLTRQEAMTIVVSGGILQPDRFTRNH